MKYLLALILLTNIASAQFFPEYENDASVSGKDPHRTKQLILKALKNANAQCFRSNYSGGLFELTGSQLIKHFSIGDRNILINTEAVEPYVIMEYWWDKHYARTDFYLSSDLKKIKAFRDFRVFSENNPIMTGMLASVEDINNGNVYMQMDVTCYIDY